MLVIWRPEVRPFTERQIALVTTFADQAAIAIENVRCSTRRRKPSTSSGIRRSARRHQQLDRRHGAVFDRILTSCERLFGGKVAGVSLVDPDGLIRLRAYHGPNREQLEAVFPLPVDMTSGSGACIATRSIVHYPDVEAETVPEATRRACRAVGYRGVIFAPMVWEGRGIGVIFVGRDFAGAFSEKDIALLKTFADQAVIAIQNARLWTETQESLARQTATATSCA